MLLSSLIPTLLTLLSFGTAVAEAHSLRSPRQHQGRSAALAERGISVGAPHYSLYLYGELLRVTLYSHLRRTQLWQLAHGRVACAVQPRAPGFLDLERRPGRE